jgi:hypothetical protein
MALEWLKRQDELKGIKTLKGAKQIKISFTELTAKMV